MGGWVGGWVGGGRGGRDGLNEVLESMGGWVGRWVTIKVSAGLYLGLMDLQASLMALTWLDRVGGWVGGWRKRRKRRFK